MYQSPIKKALGRSWESLPQGIRKHYEIWPGVEGHIILKGIMEKVDYSIVGKFFLVMGRLFGALVPYKGDNISSVVINWSASKSLFWHRIFFFPNKAPIYFSSRMDFAQESEIVEYVRFGIGLRMAISVEDSALVYKSLRFCWKIGWLLIPIPSWIFLGQARIIETTTSDSNIHVDFKMNHPIFGQTFAYSGSFTMISEPSHF